MSLAFGFAISPVFAGDDSGGMAGPPPPPVMRETFYLLAENGDRLTDEDGNLLVWRLD